MDKIARLFVPLVIFFLAALPAFAAQVVQLFSKGESVCHDFKQDLRFSMGGDKDIPTKVEIIRLQSALSKDGFSIQNAQTGLFDVGTLLAVAGFQEKYKEDILIPAGLPKANGYVGGFTRKKLNDLHGCKNKLSAGSDNKVIVRVQGILLDKEGVSVTFCNNSSHDIPTFPTRVRLNGIIREFDIRQATTANTCYPARWPYETWGLPYDPDVVYTAVVSMDPFGYYKKGALFYPDLETITVPAIFGKQFSIRSLLSGRGVIQGTFCNMGTEDVKFVAKIFLNGIEKRFYISGANESGKCVSARWPFSEWGVKYSTGENYTITVYTGAELGDNSNNDFGEFSNAAALVGPL